MVTQPRLPDPGDTIVALSSAAGRGARAIVRLSGPRAAAIAATAGVGEAMPAAGRFLEAKLRLPGFSSTIAADVYYFRGPRTYTGQDVVEIHTVSCQPIVDEMIAQCLNAGARAAQPGEFTMRAFLSGKLDLTRAEAVLGVIEAGDRHELRTALAQLAGGIATPLHALRDDLLNLLADVEAGLDFADEDIRFVQADDLLLRLGRGLAHLTNLHKQLEQRWLGQRPFRVVLAGKPNAGKSSLFNALVGENAALVDALPGTTRDFLEAVIEVDGVRVELVDTAGVHSPEDEIAAAAQGLGAAQAREADLVLWCQACDDEHTSAVVRAGSPCLLVATKADRSPPPPGMMATSVTLGLGLEEVRQRLAEEVRGARSLPLAPSLSRCRHHVDTCLEHLRRAHANVIEEELPELLALELRLALEELGVMAGAVYTDDLLDRVFSRFCIGK